MQDDSDRVKAGGRAQGDFDPVSPETLRDPHAAYAELRRSCPLAHSERWDGFWTLTRYEDILAVTKDHETFINSVQNVVPAVATTGRRPPLHFDPPEHTLWRKALSGPFKASSLAKLEPKVRTLTVELLLPLLAKGRGDLSADLASTLPILVLCAFLSSPRQDTPADIRAMTDGFLQAFQARDLAALERESRRLYAIAAEILEARKQQPLDPQEDVASALLAMRIDGEPVSDALMQGALRQLLIAGHVALTMTIGSAIMHLAQHGDLQQELRHRPERIASAIEELLRLYTPNQGFCRTTSREVALHGQAIHPREPIVLSYPSANRDELVFERPDEFVFDRPEKHIAFGHGVHKCPGELLARLQVRVVLEELLARTKGFSLDGPVEFAQWPEYGPRSLPLRFLPA